MMLNNHLISYRGPSFPLRAGGKGYFALSDNSTLIKESIRQILGTRVGERAMRRDFGSRIHELVFEPDDQILLNLAVKYTYEDVIKWEKRILISEDEIEASIDPDNHSLSVIISYRIRRLSVKDKSTFVLRLERR